LIDNPFSECEDNGSDQLSAGNRIYLLAERWLLTAESFFAGGCPNFLKYRETVRESGTSPLLPRNCERNETHKKTAISTQQSFSRKLNADSYFSATGRKSPGRRGD
jgi:hypothetical protein